LLEQLTSSFETVTVPLSQTTQENGVIMSESTKDDQKKSEPKHAAPKLTRAERKERNKNWGRMSNEHHER
jgi:hypothetical protein